MRSGEGLSSLSSSYLEGVEFGGLFLAMIATALVAYVVPSWIDRRQAVATSREGDRFSPQLMLVDSFPGSLGKDSEPSSRPILASSVVMTNATGKPMSDQTHLVLEAPARPVRAVGPLGQADPKATREYAALRAKKAAILAREKAAAKRRAVTTVVGLVAAVALAVAAGLGPISWWWMVLPGSFLLGTIIASMTAAERTRRITDEQDARLAEIREKSTQGARQAMASKPEAAVPDDAANLRPAAQEEEPAKAADSEVSKTDHSDGETATPTKLVSGGEWTYSPVPRATYSRKAPVRNRVVHADTDIRSISEVRIAVGLPARPIAVSAKPAADKGSGTSSQPTLKFDLDAVLDQRRAQ